MAPNPTREVLLHLLSMEKPSADDVDALVALAEVVVNQIDVGPHDFDAAIALAHQHLADIRSQLIEAGLKGAHRLMDCLRSAAPTPTS